MESAALQQPGCASWNRGARYRKYDSRFSSLFLHPVQLPLRCFLAARISQCRPLGVLESWEPAVSGKLCMRPPHAIYRHGRLESVESVFGERVLVEGATSEAQDDLDALSELYLASGNWDNVHNTASSERDQNPTAPYQVLDWKLEDVMLHEGAHVKQADINHRAHSHSTASTSGAFSVSEGTKRSMRDPLREKQKYVADLLNARGPDPKERRAVTEDKVVRNHQESSQIMLGAGRPFTQDAKSWHEVIEGKSFKDLGPNSFEQEQSVGRQSQHSQPPNRKQEVDVAFKSGSNTRRRLESGQQHSDFVSVKQQSPPRRQHGFPSVGDHVDNIRSVPKVRQRQVRQKESREASKRMHGQKERVGQSARQQATTEAQAKDKDGIDTLQGLFLGRAGWGAIIAAVLRWTERLTRVMSSIATKSLPQSMPRQAVAHVLNGALAIGVIWICKAALQVALTLGATLCCLFVISRVFWDLSVTAALSGSGRDRVTARETDQRGSRQERETVWPNEARSRRESSSGGLPDAERVFRTGRASRYSEDDKDRQSRSGGKDSGIADLLRQQAELVGGKARSFVARVIGTDVDVLQMFDMGGV